MIDALSDEALKIAMAMTKEELVQLRKMRMKSRTTNVCNAVKKRTMQLATETSTGNPRCALHETRVNPPARRWKSTKRYTCHIGCGVHTVYAAEESLVNTL